MPPAAVVTPNILTDPGFLFIAPLASTVPSNTVVGSVFTDAWPAAWLPLGATESGSDFAYSTKVDAVKVAEFFDPIRWATTEREGAIAFNLANFGLSNYRRALNGGVAALSPTAGAGTTALYNVRPATPGAETRCMIGWESLDSTLRLVCYQTLQGGEVKSAFDKAPKLAVIPCKFNLEVPTSGVPFDLWGAGASRA